ncbi:general odorant-binding protein 71 [Culicoides brevitarsis]|uniref:general odorant-binding protein 71 n=1 Tax=Culicoides brevitarsis TaxID=469753 RepID=UPI00307B43DF
MSKRAFHSVPNSTNVKMKHGVLLLFVAVLYVLSQKALGLRCRTDEGISRDDSRRVTRTCMRRITMEDSENYDEYENYDSNESGNADYGQNSHSRNNNRGRNSNNRGNSHHNNRRNHHERGHNQGYDYGNNRNGNQNWNGDYNGGRRYKRQLLTYPSGMAFSQYNPFGGNSGPGYDFNRNQYPSQNSNFDFFQGSESGNNYNNRNNNNNYNNRGSYNGNDNANKSCLMQCFFEEMKMTSNEGFPDKHKVLHVITEEMRDRELKDFYTDSIQECFHILDLGNKSDKCDYSRNLVTCLSERAKSNCDDWNGNSSILFN